METIPQVIASELSYRRQYYDAGPTSGMKCRFCSQPIQFVFLLKDPWGGTLPIGECCFLKLKEVNPAVYTGLVASLIMLQGAAKDQQSDIDQQAEAGLVITHRDAYKMLLRSGRARITAYRVASGEKEWLPKSLFELRKEMRIAPTTNARKTNKSLIRWYQRRIGVLQEKLSQPQQ
jgi:hypothetical protein